jgi:hypothetical protein
MKNRKMKALVFFATTLGIAFTSCNDKTVIVPEEVVVVKTVTDLVADTIINLGNATTPPSGSGKFSYYSLERNEAVALADSATKKWDIGLRGTTIITNNGNSGPAMGGGTIITGAFADVKTIPADSIIKVDNAPSAYALRSGNGLQWYNYNAPANLVTAVPGRVLIIRTSSGKYAKLEILNYYKGGVTPDATATDLDKIKKQRYYTFRYSYQPNGTKTF